MSTSPTQPISVVYVGIGLFAHLHRVFPVARAAAARGHRFTVVSDHRPAVEYSRAHLVDSVLLEQQEAAWGATLPGPYWPRGNRILSKIPGVGLGPRAEVQRIYGARREAILDTGELIGTVRSVDADVVFTEAECHRDIRALMGAGVPLVVLDALYGTVPGPDSPHAEDTFIPTGTLWSRVRSRAGWEMLYAGHRVRRAAERWWTGGVDTDSALDALARSAGIDDAAIDHRHASGHGYPGLPVVRPVAELLFYPGDDRHGIITGPLVDEERRDPLVDDGFAPEWHDILERRRNEPGRRLVLMAFGTMLHDQHRLIGATVEGPGRRDDVDLVLAIGRDAEVWRRRTLPENVRVFARIPPVDVLAHADAMIGSGGSGSVHEALWHGVPQVLVSGRGVAQDGLIARTVAAGLGVRVDPRRVSAHRLAVALDQVFADDEMAARARRVGAELRANRSAELAVDALEQVALA